MNNFKKHLNFDSTRSILLQFFRCARFTFINDDNLTKVRHDISRNFKNKEVEFLKNKINEPETNTKKRISVVCIKNKSL